jgi:hypothetical protein
LLAFPGGHSPAWTTSKLSEGDKFNLLYVLAFQVEILGMFADWPATTTIFANCYDLSLIDRNDDDRVDPGIGTEDDDTDEETDDDENDAFSASQILGLTVIMTVANGLFLMMKIVKT